MSIMEDDYLDYAHSIFFPNTGKNLSLDDFEIRY